MNISVETPLCFGNYGPFKKDCKRCPVAGGCLNDQAGFKASELLNAMDAQRQRIEACGEPPDWVYKWDEYSDEELNTLKTEDPKKYAIYQGWSSFYKHP